ncbi:hypothetical protein [Verminephrobacter eiseniae]|nr:hypothetical protein [Verminephrobacter eiseniae]
MKRPLPLRAAGGACMWPAAWQGRFRGLPGFGAVPVGMGLR